MRRPHRLDRKHSHHARARLRLYLRRRLTRAMARAERREGAA